MSAQARKLSYPERVEWATEVLRRYGGDWSAMLASVREDDKGVRRIHLPDEPVRTVSGPARERAAAA